MHDRASSQTKTQYNSNTKISQNELTPLGGFDDSMIIRNLTGIDLFTDINMLNSEMKALHTPRELKLNKIDFAEYNLANQLLEGNKSSLNVENDETNAFSSKTQNKKALSKGKKIDNDIVYRKINLKNNINIRKYKTPLKNNNVSTLASNKINPKISILNSIKKDTIDSTKKDFYSKAMRLDKYLNSNNEKKPPETALLKLDFKYSLRNYNMNTESNRKSLLTTKSLRNKSSDRQMKSYCHKSSENTLSTKKISSLKRNDKIIVPLDSENTIIKQIEIDKKSIMTVFDTTFGNQMERYNKESILFNIYSLRKPKHY